MTIALAVLAIDLAEQDWVRLSAGAGSKGERVYQWQRVLLHPPADRGWRRWLVFRRSLSDPSEVTAYTVFAPVHTTLTTQVHVAGKRWTAVAQGWHLGHDLGRTRSAVLK